MSDNVARRIMLTPAPVSNANREGFIFSWVVQLLRQPGNGSLPRCALPHIRASRLWIALSLVIGILLSFVAGDLHLFVVIAGPCLLIFPGGRRGASELFFASFRHGECQMY